MLVTAGHSADKSGVVFFKWKQVQCSCQVLTRSLETKQTNNQICHDGAESDYPLKKNRPPCIILLSLAVTGTDNKWSVKAVMTTQAALWGLSTCDQSSPSHWLYQGWLQMNCGEYYGETHKPHKHSQNVISPLALGAVHKLCQPKMGRSRPPLPPLSAFPQNPKTPKPQNPIVLLIVDWLDLW